MRTNAHELIHANSLEYVYALPKGDYCKTMVVVASVFWDPECIIQPYNGFNCNFSFCPNCTRTLFVLFDALCNSLCVSAIVEQPRSELNNENSRFNVELTIGLSKYF